MEEWDIHPNEVPKLWNWYQNQYQHLHHSVPTEDQTRDIFEQCLVGRERKGRHDYLPTSTRLAQRIAVLHGKDQSRDVPDNWVGKKSLWPQFTHPTKCHYFEDYYGRLCLLKNGLHIEPIENMYNILVQAHVESGRDGQHGDRDQTWKLLQTLSATGSKEVVNKFLASCPHQTCTARRCRTRRAHANRNLVQVAVNLAARRKKAKERQEEVDGSNHTPAWGNDFSVAHLSPTELSAASHAHDSQDTHGEEMEGPNCQEIDLKQQLEDQAWMDEFLDLNSKAQTSLLGSWSEGWGDGVGKGEYLQWSST